MPSPTTTRWEYHTLSLEASGFMGGKVDPSSITARLDTLGRDGWELVAAFDTSMAYGASRSVVLILKRPAG